MISYAGEPEVLLDTGPLVALYDSRDAQHVRCVEQYKRIRPPLLTSWAVLTEAAWLLRHDQEALDLLYRGRDRGLFEVLPIADGELAEIEIIYRRYRDISPQLADLTLVYLAEREKLDTVFTLDRRDFQIYRINGRQAFRLLPGD